MARDHRAIYARRAARAKAEGFTGLREKQAFAKSSAPTVEKFRQAANETRARAAALRRQIHELPESRLVTTTKHLRGFDVIDRQLAGHGTGPTRLIVVTKEGKVLTLYGGGRNARDIRSLVGQGLGAVAGAVNEHAGYKAAALTVDQIASVQVELLDGWPA